MSAATAVYAAAIEPKGLIVTRYATAAGLAGGRKLSITVIADLHAGGPDMGLAHVRRIVDRANGLQSDIGGARRLFRDLPLRIRKVPIRSGRGSWRG